MNHENRCACDCGGRCAGGERRVAAEHASPSAGDAVNRIVVQCVLSVACLVAVVLFLPIVLFFATLDAVKLCAWIAHDILRNLWDGEWK